MALEVRLRLACYYLQNEDRLYSRLLTSNWGLSLDHNFGNHMEHIFTHDGSSGSWLNCWDVDTLAQMFSICIQLLYPYIPNTHTHENDALDCTYRFNAEPGIITYICI